MINLLTTETLIITSWPVLPLSNSMAFTAAAVLVGIHPSLHHPMLCCLVNLIIHLLFVSCSDWNLLCRETVGFDFVCLLQVISNLFQGFLLLYEVVLPLAQGRFLEVPPFLSRGSGNKELCCKSKLVAEFVPNLVLPMM